MKTALVINEAMLFIMAIIYLYIVIAFYKSKNGALRKLMVWYFGSMAWAVLFSVGYYLFGFTQLVLTILRSFAILPALATLIFLLIYLRKQNKK